MKGGHKEGIACSAVQSFDSVAHASQVSVNEYLAEYRHETLGLIKMLGPVFRLGKTLGEQNEEILAELGFPHADVQQCTK